MISYNNHSQSILQKHSNSARPPPQSVSLSNSKPSLDFGSYLGSLKLWG